MSLYFGNSQNINQFFGGSNFVIPETRPGSVSIGNFSAFLKLTNFEVGTDSQIMSSEDE